MEEALRIHSIVRVLKKTDKSFCGMGFLIGDKYILTCMHVILDSLGIPKTTEALPFEDVIVDFPGLLPITQIAEASIYQGYLCNCNNVKKDVAILRIKDPDKLRLKNVPLLSFTSNNNLPGISCSFFISKDITCYGWGDGVINESVIEGRIQINQMISGSGKLIGCGFSGTPVWVKHMNGVVGMIDQVIPNKGIATFIPNSILIDCLPVDVQRDVIPGYINRLKAPKLPPDYIKRESQVEQINSLINDQNHYSLGNLVILVGPSGSGKTHIALDIFYNCRHVKYWFDCKTIYQQSDLFTYTLNLQESDLIVIDNLTMNHLLYKEGWLKDIKSNILVITCEESLAEELCLQFYKKKSREKIVYSTGFNLRESTYYLRLGIPEDLISSKEVESLHHTTQGMPLLMDFIKSIILEEKQIIESENRTTLFTKKESFKKYLIRNEFSISEVKTILIEKWLLTLDEHSKVVIGILSFVPIIGMSTDALLKTYNTDEKKLQDSIISLCDKGFIRLQFKGTQKDNLLVIHDLIKELVIENKKLNNPLYIDRYIEYLERKSNEPISKDADLVSKIDILMLQMKMLFNKVRSNQISYDHLFSDMYNINESINKHIPFDIGSSVTSEWIGKILEKAIPTADCALLISLGQSVYNFKANAIMAESIWQGAHNYDSWARACCIHAAVSHWKRLGKEHVDIGKIRLSEWLTQHLKTPDKYSQNKGDNRYYDNQIDLDVSTALGGLCHLGFENTAIDFLNQTRFNEIHRCTVASDLVVIIFLASNIDATKAQKGKAQKLIDNYFKRISNSSVLFLADEFLEEKGFSITSRIGQNRVLTAQPFGGTIACAAYSKEFRQFTYDRGDKLSMIGGIRPDRL